ncbi:MAG: efflux RND transporter periplasmic adaptor subunit [Gammaproteobacteria bacterium]|nr:efflux RND transporter periplasmic adaptor subunit [Gammaproteobacteria bacterium]
MNLLSARSAGLLVTVLVTGVVLLTGCISETKTPYVPALKSVGVYTIESQPLDLTVDLPGRTVAYRLAEVRPQVDGLIEQRLFTEGAEVSAGQQLYQIEDNKYRAAYQHAQAALHNAATQRRRYQELVKSGSVSKQQFDDADAAWKLAQANAELARIDLENTRILAPVSGRIGRSAVSEGALINQGQAQALATIQQIDPIYVDITQPVVEMLRLQDALDANELQGSAEGAQVQLLLENGSLYPYVGSLRFSEVSVDQGTGSVTMRAILPNPERRLLPGMFVHARLLQGRKQDALLVPQQAVQRDATGAPAVWVVDATNKVELRSIKTARTVGNMWLVSAGLQAGEKVVTEGLLQLRPGLKVEPVPASNVNPILDFNLVAQRS